MITEKVLGYYKQVQLYVLPPFGTFNNDKGFVNINNTLTRYRYSIAIENDVTSYFFTEKITNCFASLTIPIYLGASCVDKFFNKDGIIKIDTKVILRKLYHNVLLNFIKKGSIQFWTIIIGFRNIKISGIIYILII